MIITLSMTKLIFLGNLCYILAKIFLGKNNGYKSGAGVIPCKCTKGILYSCASHLTNLTEAVYSSSVYWPSISKSFMLNSNTSLAVFIVPCMPCNIFVFHHLSYFACFTNHILRASVTWIWFLNLLIAL